MGQRYRLRFLLQEFDLRGPEVLIGRSPDCHITIEDPLVSRRHARIRIEDGAPPELRDLGSRNGVRLNGTKIDGPKSLSNGDRLRIGTQELVFFVPREQKREARTTGFMATCQSCGTPYPESVERCPHCGATAREDDTMSGVLIEARQAWTFQLLGEVIDRALETDRLDQADRMMRRAAREVDERLTAGDRLQQEQLSIITGYALRLAEQAA
ncbi:MAG: FHA domain-containing protein, partial [Myxococcota bacterium]